MQKGFTLIEMIIYIAMIAILGTLIINSMLFLAPSYNSLKVTRDINNAAVVSIDRLTREIRAADNVDTANSVFESSEGKLVLNNGPDKISIYLEDGRVYIQEGVSTPSPLTKGNIIVSGFIIEHFIGTQSEVVQMSITIEGSERTFVKNETFYTAAVMRNLYTLGSVQSEEAESSSSSDDDDEDDHTSHHSGYRHHHGQGSGETRHLNY